MVYHAQSLDYKIKDTHIISRPLAHYIDTMPRNALALRGTKVKATIPLMHRTLVPRVCRVGGVNSFTNFCSHAQSNLSATALVARVQLGQSHGSA